MDPNDSFSNSNENNFILQDINPRPQKYVKKSSSPIFGASSSKIEDHIQNAENNSFFDNNNSHNDASQNEIKDFSLEGGNEKGKARKLMMEIEDNEEKHKQQILHIETLGMMTKYQLVFIKLETAMFKLGYILESRENMQKSDAFYSILNYIKFNELALVYKKKLVTNKLKKTISNNLISPINFFIKRITAIGFYTLYEHSKIFSNQKRLNEELNLIKEENSLTLQKKDSDLRILQRKSEELSNEIHVLKAKEAEYSLKIKLQDQTIFSLQQENPSETNPQQAIKKNMPINEGSSKVKALEQKFKDLDSENQDLKEKLNQTENNLGMFIKEMSELLDTHEISTNLGTDDNFSLNNSNNVNFEQNIEEELENLLKMRGKNTGEERNSGQKSHSTKENRLLSQSTKNAVKSHRGNFNTNFAKPKK